MATPTSPLQHTREVGVSSAAAGPLYVPWQTISALASETGQAVRQTFSDTGIGTSGHVQQGMQYHVSPSEHSDHSLSISPKSQVSLLDSVQANWKAKPLPQLQGSMVDSGQADWKVEDIPAADDVGREAVQAEVQRVQTKMVSTNAATEVVLRFNYMGGRESKVGYHCCGSDLYQGPTRSLSQQFLCAGCIAVPGGINPFGGCCVDNRICAQDAGGRSTDSCSDQVPLFASSLVPLTILTHPTNQPTSAGLFRKTSRIYFSKRLYMCGILLLAACVG